MSEASVADASAVIATEATVADATVAIATIATVAEAVYPELSELNVGVNNIKQETK